MRRCEELPCYTGSCSCQGKFVADQGVVTVSSAIGRQLSGTERYSLNLQLDPSLFLPRISLIWLEATISFGPLVAKHGWQPLFCLLLQVYGAQMTDLSSRGGIQVRTAQLLCIDKLSHPSKIDHSAEETRTLL
jgi:hypothetical protein